MDSFSYDISSVPKRLQRLVSDSEIKELGELNGRPLWMYWEEFVYDYLVIRERSAATVKNVRDKLRFAIFHMNLCTIEELNDVKAIKYRLGEQKRLRNWSGTTYNSARKDLNTYLKWLCENEYIEENKIKKVAKVKEKINTQLCMTEDQVNKLKVYVLENRTATFIGWKRNIFFVHLMFLTGLRTCELSMLKISSIKRNPKGKYVLTVEGAKQKGKKRSYSLPDALVVMLEEYMRERKKLGREEDWLFVSVSNKGVRWTEIGMQKYMQRLSETCGFRVTVYSLRRYVATRLYEAGVPLDKIRHYLGHNRVTTTLRYIQNSSVMTEDCMDVLAGVIG